MEKTPFEGKLFGVLKQNPDFLSTEGEILKDRIIDSAYKADRKLIELLLGNAELKKKFFSEMQGHWVFNINDFVMFIHDKHFLNDSYTQYKNKIGLTIDGKFLNERKEVALVWPFKDTVLEGGMTKEDQKKKEIFFNEILAQDEIDKLLAPKVLTNWKRYTAKGEEEVKELKRDENGAIKENLIIKGNNLLALHTLKEQFRGKVKLIYIDPPYNTGSDSFGYNDNFNHSTWLTFMKNRLEVSRELLRDDGVIFVQCDDNEQAYLRILMNQVFGSENFITQIVIKTAFENGFKTLGNKPIRVKEYIIYFSKKIEKFKYIKQYVENIRDWDNHFNLYFDKEKMLVRNLVDELKNYNIVGPDFKLVDLDLKNKKIKDFIINHSSNICDSKAIKLKPEEIKDKDLYKIDSKDIFIYKGRMLNSIESQIQELDGKKTFVLPLSDLWTDISFNNTQNEGGVSLPNGKKAEKLIQRIINISTNKKDIILDYHLGSGTTCAVAHKMGRQYIGMEQIDSQMDLSIERLNNVLKGDESGISKSMKWKGGGDFIYFELMKYNENFVEEIKNTKDTKTLLKIWVEMKEKAFFKHNFEMQEFEKDIEEFKKLDLEKQKQVLFDVLDKNQLYINYSEIEDKKFKVEKKDKEITKKFYSL